MKTTLYQLYIERFDMAKSGRKRNYEAYASDYKSKARTLAANGVTMRQRMYTEAEFNTQYERVLNQRKKAVEKGTRKTTGNITRTLVDKQAFTLSSKQVEAMTSKSRQGQNYYKLRSGKAIEEFEFDRVNEYMEKHPDADMEDALQYARKEISTELFGSP